MRQIPFSVDVITEIGDHKVEYNNLMPSDYGINYKDALFDTSVNVCAIIYYENDQRKVYTNRVDVRIGEEYKIDGESVYEGFISNQFFGKPKYIEFIITPLECRSFKWRINVI